MSWREKRTTTAQGLLENLEGTTVLADDLHVERAAIDEFDSVVEACAIPDNPTNGEILPGIWKAQHEGDRNSEVNIPGSKYAQAA